MHLEETSIVAPQHIQYIQFLKFMTSSTTKTGFIYIITNNVQLV